MSLRNQIETLFEGRAFARPLFYSYPGGLRFELSEGGTAIEQFLLAMRKATEICSGIFPEGDPLVVCLRTRAGTTRFAHRRLLAELHDAGIDIPSNRCLWTDPVLEADRFDEHTQEWWVSVAFETPRHLIQNYLGCALSSDFGAIRPRPNCMIYLFSLAKQVMVLPYDDRGMDVVGPNHNLLAMLYRKHTQYLLDYDRPTMDASFATSM